ncbi:DUF4232 domain-containing protein [Streptacidiphilus melanogenes]|uniref:DUF4232 domain-containing protein n=1 Tax=Streptacidiphilus melanogenes TaxID=411235 RepID=UPI0006949307|nr:DUF4232 domain-containing protein [Streptacidiphilus melanogenes]
MKSISAFGILAASALCLTLSACSSGAGSTGSAGAPTTSVSAGANGSTGATGSTGTGGSTGSTAGSATGGTAGGATTGGTGTSGGSTGGSGGSTGGGLAACTGSQVTVGVGQGGAATGHLEVPLLFTNISGTSCTLYGYAGVAGLDANGKQAVQATRTLRGFTGGLAQGATAPSTITVPAHGRASALLEWTDVPEGNATSCPTYTSVLVTPPGTKTSTRIASIQPTACTLQIHPVVSGTTGDQQ